MQSLWGLLLLPLMAHAASGGWHASVSGPGLTQRGSWLVSPALPPATGVSGAITMVNWRYQLNMRAPSGLKVRLCAPQRCVLLEGASGITLGLAHLPANQALHFAFGFTGKGDLPPGLRVVSSEVMVNYH